MWEFARAESVRPGKFVTTRRSLLLGALGLSAGLANGCVRAKDEAKPATRLVTVGGTVTEIVHALGAFASIVGVDTSSFYPSEATKLPKVGYHRQFSVEGVIGLRPTLVLLTDEAGPPAAVAQLQQTGLKVVTVPGGHTVAAARERVLAVGRALALETPARAVAETFERELAAARAYLAKAPARPRVLFIYARGRGTLNVAGSKTAGDEMIRLAGGVNSITEFEGYRPMTPEAVVAAAPEILLVTAKGASDLGGDAAVLGLPGVALTPAGKAGRVVSMDDLLLLGFGPRLGKAVTELAQRMQTVLAERR